MLLEELVGVHPFPTIARRLGRKETAIERKLQELGLLNTKLNGGVLSARDLSKALNLHHRALLRLRKQHKLPLEKHNLRYGINKNISWHIKPEKFWKWAEKNKDVVNWTRYVPDSIYPEPAWLKDTIYLQKQTIPSKQKTFWTPEEDDKAWNLFYRGETHKEIAKKLGRSMDAVEKRLRRLRAIRLKEAGN